MVKRLKLVYDIKSTPNGLDVGNFVKIWEQHHVVFWDSTKEGVRPKIYGDEAEELIPLIVDTKGKEVDFEFYSQEFQEKEYWDKELHKCKNSPIYYWSNYGTTVWPHTSEDLGKFLQQAGLEELSAADNEEAQKIWEKQKEVFKKALEFVTMEHLKERKAVVEVLKAEYEAEVGKLEEILKEHVGLFDSNNVHRSLRKRIGNLSDKIKKIRPVHKKYSEKYRTKQGKWDIKMLLMTDYKVLLRIYYDILKDSNRLETLLDGSTPNVAGAGVDAK